MKLIVVSGGFDPIHSGHIAYFKSAKSHGDKLIVALNSDSWLEKKKSKFFMPFDERKAIVESIQFVDEVVGFKDDSIGSCINALEEIKKSYPNEDIYFANGGDRDKKNIPEMSVSGISFLFGVGGNDKKNSSSWILNKWKYYFEKRQWGSFFNLFESFQGYVDFFLLHDLVLGNCSEIKFWLPFNNFDSSPLPNSIDEYFSYSKNVTDFVLARNQRIQNYEFKR